MSWIATHRITLTPADGGSLKHWLVMLCKDPYSQGGMVGVTEDDFRRQGTPSWRWRPLDNSWWHMGRPMPLVRKGEMRIEPLTADATDPTTLRYLRRHSSQPPTAPSDPGARPPAPR